MLWYTQPDFSLSVERTKTGEKTTKPPKNKDKPNLNEIKEKGLSETSIALSCPVRPPVSGAGAGTNCPLAYIRRRPQTRVRPRARAADAEIRLLVFRDHSHHAPGAAPTAPVAVHDDAPRAAVGPGDRHFVRGRLRLGPGRRVVRERVAGAARPLLPALLLRCGWRRQKRRRGRGGRDRVRVVVLVTIAATAVDFPAASTATVVMTGAGPVIAAEAPAIPEDPAHVSPKRGGGPEDYEREQGGRDAGQEQRAVVARARRARVRARGQRVL